jgi:hypothetical protein
VKNEYIAADHYVPRRDSLKAEQLGIKILGYECRLSGPASCSSFVISWMHTYENNIENNMSTLDTKRNSKLT